MPRQLPNQKENQTMASPITWKEPGPSLRGGPGRQPGVWLERLQPLTAHAGRWAVIHTAEATEGTKATPAQKASAIASQLKKGKLRAPEGKWEFTSRQGEVFAKYVGPE